MGYFYFTSVKARTHWANFPSADSNNRPTVLQSRPILPPILREATLVHGDLLNDLLDDLLTPSAGTPGGRLR